MGKIYSIIVYVGANLVFALSVEGEYKIRPYGN